MQLPYHTANVLVTTNKASMQKLFFNVSKFPKKPLSELIEKDSDVFLFAPGKESGLISFRDSWGRGSSPTMTLEFLDPEKEFENRFFQTGLQDRIDNVISWVQAQSGITSEFDLEAEAVKLGKFSDIIKEEEEAAHPRVGGMVFVAYGLGPDINKWTISSGKIINVSMDVSKGAREITITLAPTLGFLSTKEFMDAKGIPYPSTVPLDTRYTATAKPLEDYDAGKRRVGGGDLTPLKADYDFHRMFVDLLTDYLKTVSTEHVIVLLPDADQLLNKSINADRARWAGPNDNELNSVMRDFGLDPGGKDADIAKSLANKGWIERFLSRFGIELTIPEKIAIGGGAGLAVIEQKVNLSGEEYLAHMADLIPEMHKNESNNSLDGINKIINEFQKGWWGADYIPDFQLYWENNLRVLDIWKKELGIGNGSDPVTVYGDRRLIGKYLYFSNKYKVDSVKLGGKKHPDQIERERGTLGEWKTQNDFDREDPDHQHKSILRELLKTLEADSTQDKDLIKRLKKQIGEPGDTASSNAMPGGFIRETDKKRFSKKTYKDAMRKFNSLAAKGVDTEGRGLQDSIFALAESLGYPFFRSNTSSQSKNNVTSVRLDLHEFYWLALGIGYSETAIPRVAEAMANNQDIDKAYAPSKNIKSLVKEWLAGTRDSNELMNGLKKDLKGSHSANFGIDEELYIFFVLHSILNSMKVGAGSVRYVLEKRWGINPAAVQMHVMEALARQNYEIEIETLPMFHLSGPSTRDKNCILLMNDLDVHGILKKEVNFSRDSMHDGVYVIFGYEHEISTSEVSSKFSLTRLPQSGVREVDIALHERA